ncbi:MAG TPA: LemA family protein [Chitinophagaceae bacterium]|nr:LemA family protein [Chitinophagaceae bacterium]
MKGRNLVLIVIVALILILGGCGCSGYNRLVGQDESVKKAWANVQSDYQNRADLVPNLVNTVKGAANFEQETLTQVIEARAKATSVNVSADSLTPERMQQFQQAQAQLSGALSRLLVTVERYPELKANQNFLQLQGQLEGIENGIRNSRNTFNAAVNDYNVQVRRFPTNIFAGMFGFRPRESFTADEGAQNAPRVQF